MKKRLLAFALVGMMLVACGKENTQTEGGNNVTPAPTEEAAPGYEEVSVDGVTMKNYFMSESNAKLLGRTYMDEGTDTLWFSFSATGVEFEFTGKTLNLRLRSDGSVSQENRIARYAVYVDDELKIDEQFEVGVGIRDISVLSSDSSETHVIKLVKLSETGDSTMGIMFAQGDADSSIKPTPEKDLKIEFVGDSITCGYGVDGTLEDSYCTANEDATKAYAYQAAKLLDADYSLVSLSGHGIVSGYTSKKGSKQDKQLIPDYYDKFGNTYGGTTFAGMTPVSIEWDFSKFVPDVVVINLGTNDYSYTGNDAALKEEYIMGYYDFLTTVREKNPDAVIIGTLGVMGQNLYPQVEEAVKRFTEDTGDDKVFAFKLDQQDSNNGVAVDWHPTAASHKHAADQISEFIKSVIK